MVTLVLTNRNRELRIVNNCLKSLSNQSFKNFQVILVDYGSETNYSNQLEAVVNQYDFIRLISCPVKGQLWNKCRAINIALKKCKTDYFLVGDIDLMFHPDFVKIASEKASKSILYFKYSFLSKEESKIDKVFEQYKIDFQGNEEITGTTLFPKDKLLEVNGYDEFYHGWGAEDTDIHIRMKQLGLKIEFYDEKNLIKHQWHPKAYRSKTSITPYHSKLERINQRYMMLTESHKRIKANVNTEWGLIPNEKQYSKLSTDPDIIINSSSIDLDIASLFAQFKNLKNEVVKIQINSSSSTEKVKQSLKKILNKKYFNYLNLETVNNLLLEEIIKNYRNAPYFYEFNRSKGEINLAIFFNE